MKEGFLHITGRFKDEYKLANGKYVHPEGIENEAKLLRWILNIMLYGDGKEYNVAFVVPDFRHAAGGSEDQAALKDTLEASLKEKALTDYLSGEIINVHLRKTTAATRSAEFFLFIADDFTVDNGMLTQTMKSKRPFVLKKYRSCFFLFTKTVSGLLFSPETLPRSQHGAARQETDADSVTFLTRPF
jgi:long-chain acyl-CoA synthetase